MSKARLGTFEDLLRELPSDTPKQIKTIALKLRDTILEGFPDATEVVRLGDGAASYGVGAKKMSESHVYVMPKSNYVNLGFWHGVKLADPQNLLEGTGKKMRHVKIHELEQADSTDIKILIAEALKERKQALGLLSEG